MYIQRSLRRADNLRAVFAPEPGGNQTSPETAGEAEPVRPTIMKISTDAIAANARAIRARIPEKVRMMCVVKADAYGHDSVQTAKKLLDAGADAFAVAIVEEAEALRGPASTA